MSALNSFSRPYKYFPFNMISKPCEKWICDPLTTIIRLYTLQYRPPETKLDFSFGAMAFDLPTPNAPILQWIFRRLKGVGKDDLIILKEPVNQFLKIYNLQLLQLKTFARGAIKGLEKLHICYQTQKNVPILDCIEYYIALITKSLESADNCDGSAIPGIIEKEEKRNEDEDKDIENIVNDEDKDVENIVNDETKNSLIQKSTDTMYSKSAEKSDKNGVWTIEQINIIYSMSIELELQAEKGDTVEIQCLIDSIDKILEPKDAKFKLLYGEN